MLAIKKCTFLKPFPQKLKTNMTHSIFFAQNHWYLCSMKSYWIFLKTWIQDMIVIKTFPWNSILTLLLLVRLSNSNRVKRFRSHTCNRRALKIHLAPVWPPGSSFIVLVEFPITTTITGSLIPAILFVIITTNFNPLPSSFLRLIFLLKLPKGKVVFIKET